MSEEAHRVTFEPVFLVIEFWDGPRSGLAMIGGQLQAFSGIFDEASDDWSELFLVAPVVDNLAIKVLSAWGRLRTHERHHFTRGQKSEWEPSSEATANQHAELLEEARQQWQGIRPTANARVLKAEFYWEASRGTSGPVDGSWQDVVGRAGDSS
jgi:hypothetical protein